MQASTSKLPLWVSVTRAASYCISKLHYTLVLASYFAETLDLDIHQTLPSLLWHIQFREYFSILEARLFSTNRLQSLLNTRLSTWSILLELVRLRCCGRSVQKKRQHCTLGARWRTSNHNRESEILFPGLSVEEWMILMCSKLARTTPFDFPLVIPKNWSLLHLYLADQLCLYC